MTVRRFNYTGRRGINFKDVSIRIRRNSHGPSDFTAELNLAPYRLPADADVFVEAYRQTTWMRFSFGTIRETTRPSNTSLSLFDFPDGVLFRVRVTSTGDKSGMLLAEADKIRPVDPDQSDAERNSLLPVIPDADMGAKLYYIDYSDEPQLHVNSNIQDCKAIARSPVFTALVYPAIFREILSRILYVETHNYGKDPNDWKDRWLTFALNLPGSSQIPQAGENGEYDLWIEDAVSAFSTQTDSFNQFQKYVTEEKSS